MGLKLYTYKEIAEIFSVTVGTVRFWKSDGQFKVFGYRRLGKWAQEALVEEEEVKRLMHRKFPPEFRKSR